MNALMMQIIGTLRAKAPITVIGAASATGSAPQTLNLSLPAPGFAVGDVVINEYVIAASSGSVSATGTGDKGDVVAPTSFDSGAATGHIIYYVVTQADVDAGLTTFSTSGTGAWSSYVAIFRGVEPATPLDVAASAQAGSSATSGGAMTAPGITTVTDDCLALYLLMTHTGSATPAFGVPAPFTPLLGETTTPPYQFAAAAQTNAAAALSDVTGSLSLSPDGPVAWLAALAALRPIQPKVILTPTLPTPVLNTAYTGSITATNVDGATGTITITASDLPAGLSAGTVVDNGDGSYTLPITGTPTTTGAFDATFDAGNGTQSASYEWTGTVSEASASPVLVQYTTYSYGNSNKANLVLPAPPTAGNLLLLEVRGRFNTSAPDITGWNKLTNTGPTSQPSHVYWKISDGSEQSGLYSSGSGSNGVGGALMEWSGVTTAADHYGDSVASPITGGTATTDTPPDPAAIPVIFFNQRGGQSSTLRVTSVESGWSLIPNAGLANQVYEPGIAYNLTAPGAATSVDFTLGDTTTNYYQYDVVWIY